MKMTQIVDKLYTLLNAATSTYLAAARGVYKYDFPVTAQNPDNTTWEVRIVPLPGTEGAEYMGDTGWRATFDVDIEARRPGGPHSAADLQAASLMVEEILQVIVDNRELVITGESEAASMSTLDGGNIARMTWETGSDSDGEVSYITCAVHPHWEGPQIAPSS